MKTVLFVTFLALFFSACSRINNESQSTVFEIPENSTIRAVNSTGTIFEITSNGADYAIAIIEQENPDDPVITFIKSKNEYSTIRTIPQPDGFWTYSDSDGDGHPEIQIVRADESVSVYELQYSVMPRQEAPK